MTKIRILALAIAATMMAACSKDTPGESTVVGGSAADNGDAPSWLPSAGTAYHGCTVLAATVTGDDTADLLLLAPASTESPLGTTATASTYVRPVAEVSINNLIFELFCNDYRLFARSASPSTGLQ